MVALYGHALMKRWTGGGVSEGSAGRFPRGGAVRKTCFLMSFATLALAACSTKKTAVNDEFKKDLELASSSDGIAVGSGATNQGLQVVSAIERTAPAPKTPAPSSRVRKYHKAPDATIAPVLVEAPSTVATPEPAPVTTAPVAVDPAPPVSPRPQPQVVNYPVGGNPGTISRGPSTGEIIGAVLGAVLRGAVVHGGGDGDSCDPRTEGRNRGTMVNRRFPGGMTMPTGTYPGRR
jgi:hypothetical protein